MPSNPIVAFKDLLLSPGGSNREIVTDSGVWRGKLVALMSSLAFSCSGKEEVRGELVVSVETDMALPKAVDTVRLEVLYRGTIHFGTTYSVGQNADIRIPGTLSIVEGESPEPVTIRVIGSKGPEPRTLRELITTVPTDRSAHVRMPIQWLCDDRAMLEGNEVVSTCGEGFTCAAGRCIEKVVPEPSLPDYTPEEVFGGGATAEEGSCFDTVGCMQSAEPVVPDVDCTIQRPVEGDVNVALRVTDDGVCAGSGRPCFVPLNGNSDEGWRSVEERLTLPLAVCDRLESGRVEAVVVSTSCPTKEASLPPCGAWSSVINAQTPPPPPLTTVEPSLVGKATTEGTLCCALHASDELLYTCECDGSSEVAILALDPDGGSPERVATFATQSPRSFVSTALVGDTLYFTDRGAGGRSTLQATDLSSGETRVLADIEADIFDTSPLLVDDASVYALASRVEDQGADVQLVRVERESGEARSIAIGSTSGLQFDQDADALYVIAHSDSGEGASVLRESRIMRLRKSDGTSQPIATFTLQGAGVERGGFVGLLVDGDRVLALSRKPAGAGKDEVKLLSFDSVGRQEELFSQTVDAGLEKFLILGTSEDATLLVRFTLSSASDDAAVLGSTFLTVPRSGGHQVNSTLRGDGPSNAAIRAPSFDSEGLYWVNTSGNVYRLPLSALR